MSNKFEGLSNVVIYGAGVRGVALSTLEENNCRPIAFCDASKEKIGTMYHGLPVLSKQELMEKYSDKFYVYISPALPLRIECQEQLLAEGVVSKERIINYYPFEKFLGCYSLNHVCIATTEGLYSCCLLGEDLRNRSPMVPWEDSIEKTVDNFFAMRKTIIEDLRVGKENMCSGCRELRNTYWNINPKIESLAISPSYPCQLSCIYCDVKSNARYASSYPELKSATEKIDLSGLLKYLEKGKIDIKEPIQISAGEISINPKKKEIFKALEKYPLQIFSNCVVYDEQISKLISRESSFLNISLDAGNRETYKIVKGLDAWNQVTENIKRYKLEGGNIEIKYIILPENCDESNIKGFVKFCQNAGISNINVSCNINVNHSMLPKAIVKAAVEIAKMGEAYGAKVKILPYFGDENMRYIMKELGKE